MHVSLLEQNKLIWSWKLLCEETSIPNPPLRRVRDMTQILFFSLWADDQSVAGSNRLSPFVISLRHSRKICNFKISRGRQIMYIDSRLLLMRIMISTGYNVIKMSKSRFPELTSFTVFGMSFFVIKSTQYMILKLERRWRFFKIFQFESLFLQNSTIF